MTCFHEVATFSVSSRRFSLLSLGFCWVHAYEIWDTEPIYARRARLSTIDWPANKNPGVNCKRLTNLTTHLTNFTNVPNNSLDLVNKLFLFIVLMVVFRENVFIMGQLEGRALRAAGDKVRRVYRSQELRGAPVLKGDGCRGNRSFRVQSYAPLNILISQPKIKFDKPDTSLSRSSCTYSQGSCRGWILLKWDKSHQ